MKEIYNEGRVVGISSYESYVRQLLSTDPEASLLTEKEWLASSLSQSSSMILKIPSGTLKGYHDYPLPEGSDLCSCTVIYGTMFEGEVSMLPDGYWASMVNSYGKLISNTPEVHPITPGTSEYVPTYPNPEVITNEYAEMCKNYIKITSGMMFQPGQWEPNAYYTPLLTQDEDELVNQENEVVLAPVTDAIAHSHVIPDMSKLGFIRLAISEDLTKDVYIFLHGFTFKTLVTGEVGYNTTEYSSNPQDGDFLGPSVYPWGCPVYLTVTSNIQYVIYTDIMSRL